MNLGAQFLKLLPTRPLLIATVVSSSGGSSEVEFAGGARLVVRGTATTGASVFVRDGAIEGTAPAPSISTIEV